MPRRVAQQDAKGYRSVIVGEFEEDVFEILGVVSRHTWNGVEAMDKARAVGVFSSGYNPIKRLAELANALVASCPLFEIEDRDVVVFSVLRHGIGVSESRITTQDTFPYRSPKLGKSGLGNMSTWLTSHYDVLKDFSGPVLTVIGFVITIGLAFAGLKTFDKWKREKIEERRIETAIDALALAYESKIVFRSIRSSMSNSNEYKEMPASDGETEQKRTLRGSYWVVGKRIYENKDYFDRVWKLQPLVMAIFSEEMEDIFGKLHEARAMIQVASQTLSWDAPPSSTVENIALQKQMRIDLWGGGSNDTDRVQRSLDEFRKGIERVCKPVVDREFSDGYFRDIGVP